MLRPTIYLPSHQAKQLPARLPPGDGRAEQPQVSAAATPPRTPASEPVGAGT